MLLTNFPVHAKAPPAAAVLGASGLVQGYMRYNAGTRNVFELLRLAWKIRRFRPDVLVYLMPLRSLRKIRRDGIFLRLAGVRRIVGIPSEQELLCVEWFTGQYKRPFDSSTGLHEPEATRLARRIASLGDAHPEDLANWDLLLKPPEKATAAHALGGLASMPLIVCSPGCKMQANDWEQENWRALLGRLSVKYPSYGLVMSGAKEDAAVCEYAALDWVGKKVNLAGLLTPRESAAAFSYARVFIGPDSGPKYLAASMGVSCVCGFSARGMPGVWFPPGLRNVIVYHEPECCGCGLETCIEMAKKCILSVTVDEMEEAVDRILSPSEPVTCAPAISAAICAPGF